MSEAHADSVAADLAVNGGTPIRATPMPPRAALGEAEVTALNAAIAHYADAGVDPGYQGHFEDLYCAAFVRRMGGGHADAVSSGTAALYVALAALELPAGSEVLTSCITDPGTISAIILNGLVPRLVDCAPDSYQMGASEFLDRVTPRSRCVVVVHAAGTAAPIDEIVAEAHARDIRVLEDCAQAHGASLDGRMLGTFGDIAAFSTMYRKAHITGGTGGVVFAADEDLFRRALAHADRGKPRWRDDFDDRDPTTYLHPALNFHLDELSCAVGHASLARLDETIAARMKYVRGMDALTAMSGICGPSGWTDGDSPFFYPLVVDTGRLTCDKTDFARSVLAEGIGLNPHYQYLVSTWPWVSDHASDDFACPNAADFLARSFNLYVNENYGEQEIADTLAAISKVEGVFAA